MRIESLLTFNCAPDFNSIFDKPFYDKRGLILFSAKPVKHKNQQNIKHVFGRILLDLLNFVSVIGGNLETLHAFFGVFPDNIPSLFGGEFMAPLFLHRDIVFFHLPFRRYTVETANSFPHGMASS